MNARATTLALVAAGMVMTLLLPARMTAQGADSLGLVRGRALFDAQCSRCHGIGGTGGMGPSLQRPVLPRAPNDSALIALIAMGIEEKGMPGAWQLGPNELQRLAAYVRSLGRHIEEPVTGNVSRGKELFAGRAGCYQCHIVAGKGGVLGPELTAVGASRGSAYLRRALRDPGFELPAGPGISYNGSEYARYLMVRATTATGRVVIGIRINEDAFTIQIRDPEGRLHSLDKLPLRSLEKLFHASLMPAVVAPFSDVDVDDLVAYLLTLRGGGVS